MWQHWTKLTKCHIHSFYVHYRLIKFILNIYIYINRVKREAYRANHTKEQKVEVLEKWKSFMREVKADYPFFEYFEKHFQWHKRNCVKTKLPSKDILPKRVRHPTRSVSPSPKVNVLEAYLSSSSSTGPSSDKEIDPLEDYISLPPVNPEDDPLEAKSPTTN